MTLKVGDIVDAYDLRDGARIEIGRRIEKLETHMIPVIRNHRQVEVPKLCAMLEDCHYWLPARCLRRVK